jgi:hypothetical protein
MATHSDSGRHESPRFVRPTCSRAATARRNSNFSFCATSCRSCSGRRGARVRSHDTGSKRFHHPVVGEFDLTYETMQLVADAGLMLFVYTAEPGSKSEQAMNLLASWAATPEEAEAPNRSDR